MVSRTLYAIAEGVHKPHIRRRYWVGIAHQSWPKTALRSASFVGIGVERRIQVLLLWTMVYISPHDTPFINPKVSHPVYLNFVLPLTAQVVRVSRDHLHTYLSVEANNLSEHNPKTKLISIQTRFTQVQTTAMRPANLILALVPVALAAPVADANANAVAEDKRGYASYGTYTPPKGGYGSYGSYPPPAGGYGSYGSYKRAVGDFFKKIFG
jgi:hypothetical protein